MRSPRDDVRQRATLLDKLAGIVEYSKIELEEGCFDSIDDNRIVGNVASLEVLCGV